MLRFFNLSACELTQVVKQHISFAKNHATFIKIVIPSQEVIA